MESAFRDLHVSLCDYVVLNVPCISDIFVLYTDASGWGLGACLHVIREKEELPVAFYSHQLQGAENHYSVTELESLAIVAAVEHFEFYLYGAAFTVYTDHRACTSLLSSKYLNKRLRRFALKLKSREVQIIYRPGKLNGNADGLSRQDWGDDGEESEDVPCGYQTYPTGDVLVGGAVIPPSSCAEGETKRSRGKEKNEERERETYE